MKNFKTAIMTLFMLTFLLGINSCQEASDPVANSNLQQTDEFSDFSLPNYDEFGGELAGLDINSDYYLIFDDEVNVDSKTSSIQCGDKNKKRHKKDYDKKGEKDKDKDCDNDEGDYEESDDDDGDDDEGDNEHHRNGCKNGINPLGKILNKLDLTYDQRHQIHEFRHDYHDCLKWAKRQVRAQQKEMIQEANQLKRQYREQYENGEITREEFKALCEQLQAQIRNKLKNIIPQEIKDCVCEYLRNIASILDVDQKAQFIEQITTEHPEFDDCGLSGGGDPPPPPPDVQ